MAVLQVKSEQRCKLCQHPKRPEIDALIEQRSKGAYDDAGNRINLDYVLGVFADWGVTNPTEDNIKNHLRKHCQLVEGTAPTAQSELLESLELLKATGFVVDVNADLDWLWAVWMLERRQAVARGEKSGLPVDFGLKVAAEKTRRQHSETQDELMKMLGGGIMHALGERKTVAIMPPAEVVEDAEFTEDE